MRCASISAPPATARWWAPSRSSPSIARPFSFARWRWRKTGGGKGSGRGCLPRAEEWARGEGYRLIVLNARLGAEGFYTRFGYLAQGEPFEENTVPHIRVTKRLASPEITASPLTYPGRKE
jgi:predicted GNAT family N-acyltransferase